MFRKSFVLRAAQVVGPTPQNIDATISKIVLKKNPFDTPLIAALENFHNNEFIRLFQISRSVYGGPIRQDIIQRAVVHYRASLRAGTASTKDRSQVSGTRRKAFAQKGRGEARVGTLRAPHRRGGGVCFGPKPRDWSTELPKLVRDFAIRSALAAKFKQDQIVFVDETTFTLDQPKTKLLNTIMQEKGWPKKTLIVDTKKTPDHNMEFAIRNMSDAEYIGTTSDKFNAYNLLKNSLIVMTRRAAEYCGNHFKPK